MDRHAGAPGGVEQSSSPEALRPFPARTSAAPRALTRATLRRGACELAEMDPDLARVLARLGVPPLWGKRPGFASLVQIILEQQVSLGAARTLYRRLQAAADGLAPARARRLGVEGLRELGLTRQKARYIHGVAARMAAGELDLSAVARADDAAGRRTLLAVPGLGPWSVDIYYLMALRRPDVWPRGDLALASAARDVKRLDGLPTLDEQRQMAQAWTPWRSIAARLLWAHYLDQRGQYRGVTRASAAPPGPRSVPQAGTATPGRPAPPTRPAASTDPAARPRPAPPRRG